ncbi:LuxR C-terminal-related transcriptional regulator [Aeromicrobium choanae]|uniref:LuxR family transcriptional regulator, maltose regulon positive regulatory protein n=1 Tax=Aeromicrobium choanae TaxID=1736691 RepID=A0A1T4Z9K7_9ACTN|nr:LuxR C-terminal-related transcriptional regulator [Aeromicrobium choanae]SKB10245.1 LuxR family transcriptional regulator, maltose regulon positive regulatory protein [Aeromicrobium choanae]
MVTRPSNDPADHDSSWYGATFGGWPGLPERPRQFVSRPRLLDQLDSEPSASLILVSAPAGTGKTSLVADWASTRTPGRLEWITFDPGDVLWPSFVDALERLGIALPASSAPSGDAGLDPRMRRDLALALASAPDPVTLVVDGYEVSSATVAADLDFLLRHSGHRLRLVLLTRSDPVLPLYRYRLEESMIELRMADLALGDDEAAGLLDQMGVRLTRDSVQELNARTRGWVTGMRFAGKLLLDHDDPDADIGQVMGESGSIAEYLMGEVLADLSPRDLDLLMALSVPDIIEPGLAHALAGEGTDRALSSLAHVNVFLETVPDRRDHYRFHPFFRDLLRAELGYRSPETWALLQRKAAQWYAAEGLLAPAARHHASIGAWEDVARLVTEHDAWAELLLADRTHPLVQVLRAVPADVEAPAAVLVRATLALATREGERFDGEMIRFAAAEGERGTDVDLARARALLLALRAREAADPGEALALADAAEEMRGDLTRRDSALVPLVLATKGIAQVRHGLTADARISLREGAVAADRSGSPSLVVECLGLLALVSCCEGDLAVGSSAAAHAVRAARDAGIAVEDRPAAAEIALAWVAVEHFDLRAATDHLKAAESSRFVLQDPASRTLLALVRSRLRAAQGDRGAAVSGVTAALDALAEADRWLGARLRVELAAWLVARGDVQTARETIDGLDDPTVAGALALVRAQTDLAAGNDAGAALAMGEARDPAAPVAVRVAASLVECARLLRTGSGVQAHRVVLEALVLARPITLRRPFHEAPAPVRQLVLQDRQLAAAHAWLFERSGAPMTRPPVRRPSEPVGPTAPVEQLTEKETEVLGHLAALLTTEEIAAEMYISVNTVRTHVRNILRKLGVSRRNAAVRIARELELLPS